jgi:hypothetical protein
MTVKDSNTPNNPELRLCIALALTYHRNKKLDAAARWKMVEKAMSQR